jgi:C-5 cytosine-specific DNA methylase
MLKPLAIDLFSGLGGWTDGLLAEGWDVIGFDIEQHVYGEHRYPAQLVVQDVLSLHGSQFKNADLIVASPPCQAYSYMAMPWTKAKAKAAAIRADETGAEMERLNALFNACFRIQREACEAAGRHIPLIVENVKGAQPWVGRARWSFGSFYLWGDVPALMPITFKATKVPGFRFDGSGNSFQSASVEYSGVKNPGLNWSAHADPDYLSSGKGACFRDTAIKNNGGSWFNVAHNTTSGKGRNPDGRDPMWQRGFTQTATDGIKQSGDWFAEARKGGVGGTSASFGSKSPARKMASAMIAKIPLPLSRHIAATFHKK